MSAVEVASEMKEEMMGRRRHGGGSHAMAEAGEDPFFPPPHWLSPQQASFFNGTSNGLGDGGRFRRQTSGGGGGGKGAAGGGSGGGAGNGNGSGGGGGASHCEGLFIFKK